jgi:D-beta-D-heptose 7-phosphate kinase/D-beta-D-heptose 1-phosphate adenosyltransferase
VLQSKKILVVGDLMIDRYLYGTASRISQEAPVVVVRVGNVHEVLGGAANVAANFADLGCSVTLVGAVGRDSEGQSLLNLCAEKGIVTNVLKLDSVPTIVKTRVISDGQHVVRIDREEDFRKASNYEDFLRFVREVDDNYDAVMLIDYSKGTLSSETARFLIEKFQERFVAADFRPEHVDFYRGVCTVSPNFEEARRICNSEDLVVICNHLKSRLNTKNVMITLSEKGLFLYDSKGSMYRYPAHELVSIGRRHRLDVSGAGDTLLSVFTALSVCGVSEQSAAWAANVAAAIVVNKLGTATCSYSELIGELRYDAPERVGAELCGTSRSLVDSSVEGSVSS